MCVYVCVCVLDRAGAGYWSVAERIKKTDFKSVRGVGFGCYGEYLEGSVVGCRGRCDLLACCGSPIFTRIGKED